MRPSDADQVQFLSNLQRLLTEGNFTSTYKYALLLALANIAIEHGDDTGAPMTIRLEALAEQFVRLYWRQARRHPAGPVLLQNTDRQAAIIQTIETAYQRHDGSLIALKADIRTWKALTAAVAAIIKKMPLLRLQTVGKEQLDFLYTNVVVDNGVVLRAGVAFCLRRFHPLVEDLVQGAWARFVRRLPANAIAVGEVADLGEFLFGSERADLSAYVGVLRDQQRDACFYCDAPLRNRKLCVDHFIPWSRYPVDLGHNFVLADSTCNESKSDMLAATVHLERWQRRNDDHGSTMGAAFTARGLLHDVEASRRITQWAYEAAERAQAQTWVRADTYERLQAAWHAATS